MKQIMNSLGRPIKDIILGKDGQPIILTRQEQMMADMLQKDLKRKNALGAEIDITTLTTIMKKVSEQKFFEIAPADFLPVRVGEGAWSSNLVTYRSYQTGGDFSEGVVNQSGNNGRLATAGAAVDAIPVVVKNWAKQISWTIMELNQAAKAGNWDLVTSLEESRKTNWDLGIQSVAFLGMAGDANVEGLLNMTGVNNNTSDITKSLKSMTAAELSTFMQVILDKYRTNCNRSAWPTHFIIPESDYLGLATPSNSDYPLKSKLEIIQDTLRIMTKNPNFQVLPLAYGDAAYNTGAGINKQRYVLLNYDEKSLRMDIPVQYTSTLANSIDNFAFQNVGYGQFTGAKAYRPLETLYFSY
jgi:hypothetical protein